MRSERSGGRVRVALLPWMVAGVQTQYEHLRRHVPEDEIEALTFEIRPFLEGGVIERLPLPKTVRGTLRSAYCTRRLFSSHVDAVWSQTDLPMLPYLVSRASWWRVPVLCVEDSTALQRAAFGDHYPGITHPRTRKGRLTHALLRTVYARCAMLLPWSKWAASSLIADYGVPGERIVILPPGVDTNRWRPDPARRDPDRPRLLFVGGDFERKGGPMLLDIWRRNLRDRCDLHLVTRGSGVAHEPGVEVHSNFMPNDPRLLELFQSCDMMVLPTQADCFSVASIEAMACGLPVLVSAVGGIPEIVREGETGFLLQPEDACGWVAAIQSLLDDAEKRRRFGEAGRRAVLERFDAARQARRTFDLVQQAIDHW